MEADVKQVQATVAGQASLFWFRRDLRLQDNAALARALQDGGKIYCCFIFDRDILDELPRVDRRVHFIRETLVELDAQLRAFGGGLIAVHARAAEAIPQLAAQLQVQAVYANHDYEPSAISRDNRVADVLHTQGRRLVTCKDQTIFERDEVLTADGRPFSVFSPYKRAWLKRLTTDHLAEHEVKLEGRLAPPGEHWQVPSLEAMGFQDTDLADIGIRTGATGAEALFEDFKTRIGRYRETRDFPGIRGPSYLSVHLRFGTISIRRLARFAWEIMQREPAAREGAESWLSELIWRDFYFQILFNNPHVVERAFRPEYDAVTWVDDPELFAAWCEGRTGYPLVDAAMLQLNRSGWMHNRLRMVTASFLTKDLGIDWRLGERYFARQLLDFDLSANNGGWQWAASTGCDAQPWFRIFNPVTQSERFDANGRFIRRYLPQLAKLSDDDIHAPWLTKPLLLQAAGVRLGSGAADTYPLPVVAHDEARQATLARFAVVKAKRTETGMP